MYPPCLLEGDRRDKGWEFLLRPWDQGRRRLDNVLSVFGLALLILIHHFNLELINLEKRKRERKIL